MPPNIPTIPSWLRSAVACGRPNINPLVDRDAAVGYSFLPQSSSSVGHGDAELKPGTELSNTSKIKKKRSSFALYAAMVSCCVSRL
uniref:Uncharacterized protein n=1 Tax=Megaselia scalaris TaxID=36166 RepID=T1H038_MEGSC